MSLPDHGHRFVSLNRSPSRRVREESQARLDLALHKPMILLNDVIHGLAGPAFADIRQQSGLLQIIDSTDVAGILVNVYHPWGGDMRSTQDFAEQAPGCSSTAGLVQEEIEPLTG